MRASNTPGTCEHPLAAWTGPNSYSPATSKLHPQNAVRCLAAPKWPRLQVLPACIGRLRRLRESHKPSLLWEAFRILHTMLETERARRQNRKMVDPHLVD